MESFGDLLIWCERHLLALIDFLLHVDRYLLDIVARYGNWVYGVLFAVVYAETGFVVTPFLPGDSLLFAAGAIAATGALDVWLLLLLIVVAAVGGNTVNYAIGRSLGKRLIHRAETDRRWGRWINVAYVTRARQFFETHGGKAIVLGRFVPIVRTFVPFVAGVAEMPYRSFTLFNVAGAVAWAGLCIGAGYLFGNFPIVKDNFSLVAIGIVLVSVLPMVVELVRHRRGPASSH
jgi:membrane-associated protein